MPGSQRDDDLQNREKFPSLSSRQDSLEKENRDFGGETGDAFSALPGHGHGDPERPEGGNGLDGEGLRKTEGEDAPGAIPPEQEAIRSLTRSQQAMQQMAQQMAMRMQSEPLGLSLGYDPRPGWYYGPWVPMPTLPQPELRRPREKGYTGIDREEFDPPSKDAYKAPQILREKVMESLKEGIPSQYQKRGGEIFQRFDRMKDERTSSYASSGCFPRFCPFLPGL